jgi:hypothetical protein
MNGMKKMGYVTLDRNEKCDNNIVLLYDLVG